MKSAYPGRLVSSKSAPAFARNGKRAENVVKRDLFARRAEKYAPEKATFGPKRWESVGEQWFLASLVDGPSHRGPTPEVGNQGDRNGYPRKTVGILAFFVCGIRKRAVPATGAASRPGKGNIWLENLGKALV